MVHRFQYEHHSKGTGDIFKYPHQQDGLKPLGDLSKRSVLINWLSIWHLVVNILWFWVGRIDVWEVLHLKHLKMPFAEQIYRLWPTEIAELSTAAAPVDLVAPMWSWHVFWQDVCSDLQLFAHQFVLHFWHFFPCWQSDCQINMICWYSADGSRVLHLRATEQTWADHVYHTMTMFMTPLLNLDEIDFFFLPKACWTMMQLGLDRDWKSKDLRLEPL